MLQSAGGVAGRGQWGRRVSYDDPVRGVSGQSDKECLQADRKGQWDFLSDHAGFRESEKTGKGREGRRYGS